MSYASRNSVAVKLKLGFNKNVKYWTINKDMVRTPTQTAQKIRGFLIKYTAILHALFFLTSACMLFQYKYPGRKYTENIRPVDQLVPIFIVIYAIKICSNYVEF